MSQYATYSHNPLTDIDCQALLRRHDYCYSGWLRKQSFRNRLKIMKWPQVYVVLGGGCVYYFGSEYAKRSHSFSLYGYNTVSRERDYPDAIWVFKIEHTLPEFKAYYFSASSEQEMKFWMLKVKEELQVANNKNVKRRKKNEDKAFDEESLTYHEIESKIYEDQSAFMIPQNYKNKRKSEADSDDDMDGRPPAAPPLPPRNNSTGKKRRRKRTPKDQTADLTSDLQTKINMKNSEGTEAVRKRRHRPEPAKMVQEPVEEPEEEELPQEDYWGSIYFDENEDKRDSSEILRKIGEDGVYLVRKKTDHTFVLCFYGGNMPRKMKILEKDGQYYISEKYLASSIEDMVYHYYENEIPIKSLNVKLEMPYQLHPKYSSVQ